MIRAQYFFHQSDDGLLAWDIRRLVELSKDLPIEHIDIAQIAELDENHWYTHGCESPTCRSLLQHMQLIEKADLAFPVILDQDGRVMDGMHRVCRAVREGKDYILAVRFPANPEPDFAGCDPDELPYDE